MQIQTPYLIFLGDVGDQLAAKTGQGIVDWRRDWCLGQIRLPAARPISVFRTSASRKPPPKGRGR